MTPIHKKLRAELNKDPFMKKCCLCGFDKVQFHHAILYRNRQVQERWAIVPACKFCHEDELDRLELVALNRATDEELKRISKAIDFIQRREYLRGEYDSIHEAGL